MCTASQLEIEAVLSAIIVHEGAQKRVPTPRELPGLTYFSVHNVWLYQEVSDHKTCQLCRDYAEQNKGEYRGNHLRSIFPYLEILDVGTIKANVHPNCRCLLVRLTEET